MLFRSVYTPDEVDELRGRVGLPPMPRAEGEEPEKPPAPLMVGSLQVAADVMTRLQATEANPVPLAPGAALEILIAAGFSPDAAQRMVTAQTGVQVATVADTAAPERELALTPETTVEAEQIEAATPQTDDDVVGDAESVRESEQAGAMPQSFAKRVAVTVYGRGMAPFDTHRQLHPHEAHVAWARLYAGTTATSTLVGAAAEAVAARQRKRFLDEYGEAIEDGDVSALASAQVDAAGDYARALGTTLDVWARAARADMLDEIRSVAPGQPATPDADTYPAKLGDAVDARGQALAQQMSDAFNRQLRDAALTEATSTRNPAAIMAVQPPTATWEKQATNATTAVTNLAREEAARAEGPEIEDATYSAIMDSATCKECMRLDGQVFA